MRDSAFEILQKPKIEAIIRIKETNRRAIFMTFVLWSGFFIRRGSQVSTILKSAA
jgi:hypothetical protein